MSSKCQLKTKDMDISGNILNNLTMHESFNPFLSDIDTYNYIEKHSGIFLNLYHMKK